MEEPQSTLPFTTEELNERSSALRPVVPSKTEVVDTFGRLPSGSLYKISRAAQYTGTPHSVLIYGHGFRPEGIPLAPSLATDTDNPHREVYEHFMREGWLMASVSYRREGYILIDAIEDIMEMRTLVLDTHFGGVNPTNGRILLQTRSMGGAIATLLNERVPSGKFDGILTLGAALMTRTDPVHGDVPFLHTPRTPQIFLANISEIAQVEVYVNKVKESATTDETIIPPIIWKVNRFGHCAVFNQELKASLEGLCTWASGEEVTDNDVTDYNQSVPAGASAWWDDERRGFWVPCSLNMYWEVEFPLSEADWRTLGINPGTTFPLEIHEDIYNVPETELPPARVIQCTYAVDPFVGIDEGTLVTWVKSVGLKSILRRHSTGTTVSTVADEFKIRREGFTLFIAEIPIHKKPVMSSKVAEMLKRLGK